MKNYYIGSCKIQNIKPDKMALNQNRINIYFNYNHIAKKGYLIFFMFFILSNIFCYSQYLTFDNLITIQKSGFEETNDLLLNKGWEFTGSKPAHVTYHSITWALNKNENNEAKGWLSLSYSDETENIVSYTIFNREKYIAIRDRIKALGMKVVKSTIDDDDIATVYEGQNYIAKISMITNEYSSITSYLIELFKKETYYAIEYGFVKERIETQYSKDEDRKLVPYIQPQAAIDESNAETISRKVLLSTILRSEPNGYSKELLKVPSNSNVRILNKTIDPEYWYVSFNGYKGYVTKSCFSR